MTRLLPFQHKRFPGGRRLLVNECGDHHFVAEAVFELMLAGALSEDHPEFPDLQSRLFVSAELNDGFGVRKAAAKYRSRKAYLRDFTSLHMMVVTVRCNQRCEYCQVSCAEQDAYRYDMPVSTAMKIVDLILEAPSDSVKIEFQGGEPTLNWEAVAAAVRYAEERREKAGKKTVDFVLCTNLTAIREDQLRFCRDHGISVSTSLDGPKDLHDRYRVLRSKGSAYDLFRGNLALAREIVGEDRVDALMTATAASLNAFPEIIDEYEELGFGGVFIRSLNPYGFAAEKAAELGYGMASFVAAYAEAFRHVMKVNRRRFFPELFATILLSRILTPFSTGFVDLQSPAGTGISGAIYDYDGSVYPSDEARMLARMGDAHFRLGNVHVDSYREIFGGARLKDLIRGACVETTPGCAYCAYQAYCGTDPVRNYLESGGEVRNMAGTPFCVKHKGIFDFLFSFLDGMTEEEEDVVWSWITRSGRVQAAGGRPGGGIGGRGGAGPGRPGPEACPPPGDGVAGGV
ncbi:MAG: His-Xaa-Ser system radical SAM maturase HxsB [Deltaproteobacteria bacterium]|jgi:His-Xaa-Ser system radical SAM maturase HxsB|nr:His-Xaa-Ser system radical SAM maturase HxsB [Deltaproteobacteria bacterium]